MKQLFTLFIATTILTAFSVEDVQAQRWNRYKKEVGVSVGATNFLGDLGGGPGIGSRYGDFQFGNNRLAFGGFFKYRFHDRFAVKANLLFGQLYGADMDTENSDRNARNLDVKTNIAEFSGQLEFYFMKEKVGSRYKIKGVKGYGSSNVSMYLFAGIGGTYFNPKGTNANGEWVALAPLNTEGQGLPNGPKDYSQVTLAFPLGFGIKYNITRIIGVQFEAGIRLTTTDYLDDVSTTYYDGDALEASFPGSKYQADKRSDNYPGKHLAGGIRGKDDHTDAYMFGLFTVTFRIKSRARSRVRL